MKAKIKFLKEIGYLVDKNNKELMEEILESYSLEDIDPNKEYEFVGGRLFEVDEETINNYYSEAKRGL